jgi:hypothetical protein
LSWQVDIRDGHRPLARHGLAVCLWLEHPRRPSGGLSDAATNFGNVKAMIHSLDKDCLQASQGRRGKLGGMLQVIAGYCEKVFGDQFWIVILPGE